MPILYIDIDVHKNMGRTNKRGHSFLFFILEIDNQKFRVKMSITLLLKNRKQINNSKAIDATIFLVLDILIFLLIN